MNTRSIRIGLCLLLSVLGCSNRDTDSGRTFAQLNWYPESEHGGLYQALADGTYADAGLDVEIRPGGSATPVAPELVLGRVQFAVTNADDVVLFRAQGADVVAVLAAMQNHPRCILVREDSGIETFEDLAGMTLQRQTGRAFLHFLRSKGLLDQVQEVPYHNSVTSLVTDKNIAIQAYSFAEPHLAEQQGVKVRKLMLSDIGWNPYSSVLITSGEMIRTEPERVRQFVQATRTGWQNYLTDPTKGNTAILAANRHGMTAEALQFGEAELRTLALPNDQPIESVGQMARDRWQTLVDQMQNLGVIEKDVVDPNECFTTEFLK